MSISGSGGNPSIETSGETGAPVAGDLLLVGGDQRAIVGQALRAEEQLGGAQHEGIVAAVEHVAQDDMDQLIEKDRRNADALADQCR